MGELYCGIDLGTTNTVVSLCKTIRKRISYEVIENETGSRLTPSVVLIKNDEVTVGITAKENICMNPERVIYGSKRLIGHKKGDEDVEKLFGVAQFRLRYQGDDPVIAVPESPLEDEEGNEIPVDPSTLKEVIYRPEQISSFILGSCIESVRAKTGRIPDRTVITVPAYFNHLQRNATERAAQIAGLTNVTIANEPTAAAIAYQYENALVKGNVLVFDFGGGTLDVSILEVKGKVFRVLAVAGDTSLGGEDIDVLIVKEMIRRFKKKHPTKDPTTNKRSMALLKQKCEEAKIRLSAKNNWDIVIPKFFEGIDFNQRLWEAELNDLCDDLFEKLIVPLNTAIKDAGLTKEQIDCVITVGGSSNIPAVREKISKYFDERIKPITGVSFSEGIAIGASLICRNEALIEQKKKVTKYEDKTEHVTRTTIKDIHSHEEEEEEEEEEDFSEPYDITDVIPISIGIKYDRNKFKKYIKRNQPLPYEKTFKFTPRRISSDHADIEIFQGEDDVITSESHVRIGKFALYGLPRRNRGELIYIDVTISVDKAGIIKVTGSCEENGIKKELSINYKEVIESEEFAEAKKKQEEMMLNRSILAVCEKNLNEIQRIIKKLRNNGRDVSVWQKTYDNFSKSRPTNTVNINRYCDMIKKTLEKIKKEK